MADNDGNGHDDAGMSIVERKPTMLQPIAQPAQIIQAHNAMREMIRGALKEGKEAGQGDYGIFPGTDKKALYKPGAEKIALGMGCYYGPPRIIEREVDHNHVNQYVKRKKEWYTDNSGGRRFKWTEEGGESRGLYRFVIAISVINRATGEIVGEGIGSCSSLESKYVDRPRETENTVLKMAHKRAMVQACLVAFGLSGEFQSGEDTEEEEDAPTAATASPKGEPANGKASASKPAPGQPEKCKKCGGTKFWDNRPKKQTGEYAKNAPDFKCANKDCGAGVWQSSKDSAAEDPGVDAEYADSLV